MITPIQLSLLCACYCEERSMYKNKYYERFERDCMKNMRALVMMSVLSGMIYLTNMNSYALQPSSEKEKISVRDVQTKGRWNSVKNFGKEVLKIGVAVAVPTLSTPLIANIGDVEGVKESLRKFYSNYQGDMERAYIAVAALPLGYLFNQRLQSRFPVLQMNGMSQSIACVATILILADGLCRTE